MTNRSASTDAVLLIPAYRPGSALPDIVSSLVEAPDSVEVLVVLDGWRDAPSWIVERLQDLSSVTVLGHARNMGKGAALKTGYRFVLDERPSVRTIVTADADGQHDIASIRSVLETGRERSRTLVLGSRSFGKDVPFRSRFGNRASRLLFQLALGVRIRDTQTGLRAVPRHLARRSLELDPVGFDFETAQLVAARESATPMFELPVATVYVDGGRGSHFRPVRDSVRILGVLFRHAGASISAALADYAAFSLMFALGTPLLAANIASRLMALTLQFALFTGVVYRAPRGPLRFVAFAAYATVGGFVSASLQSAALTSLAVSPLIAKPIIEVGLFFVNFVVLREWFLRSKARRSR